MMKGMATATSIGLDNSGIHKEKFEPYMRTPQSLKMSIKLAHRKCNPNKISEGCNLRRDSPKAKEPASQPFCDSTCEMIASLENPNHAQQDISSKVEESFYTENSGKSIRSPHSDSSNILVPVTTMNVIQQAEDEIDPNFCLSSVSRPSFEVQLPITAVPGVFETTLYEDKSPHHYHSTGRTNLKSNQLEHNSKVAFNIVTEQKYYNNVDGVVSDFFGFCWGNADYKSEDEIKVFPKGHIENIGKFPVPPQDSTANIAMSIASHSGYPSPLNNPLLSKSRTVPFSPKSYGITYGNDYDYNQPLTEGIKESVEYVTKRFTNWVWSTWVEPHFGGPLTPRENDNSIDRQNFEDHLAKKKTKQGTNKTKHLRKNQPELSQVYPKTPRYQVQQFSLQQGGNPDAHLNYQDSGSSRVPKIRWLGGSTDRDYSSAIIPSVHCQDIGSTTNRTVLQGETFRDSSSTVDPCRRRRADGRSLTGRSSEGIPTKPLKPINRRTQDEDIMSICFRTKYWEEKAILPIKERLKSPTLWQKVWSVLDERTVKEREKRHYSKVMRKGHRTITRQKWNSQLIEKTSLIKLFDITDIPKDHWFRACYTHIELTFFSIENVPYIGQIVFDCQYFRVAMPFNCRFMRLPFINEDQIVTVWFNSPVARTQRCLKTHEGFADQTIDWVGSPKLEEKELDEMGRSELDRTTHVIHDEDELTEEELQAVTDQIHDQSLYVKLLDFGRYDPQYDFPTYFKLEIPISALLTSEDRTVEDVALIDPKGVFHEVNAELPSEELFRRLLDGAKKELRHPRVKFSAKFHGQGLSHLVTTGDTQYDHPLALSERERRSGKLIERVVYVAQSGDDLDDFIGQCLNRDQRILRQISMDSIYRLHNGGYVIHGNEVEILLHTFSGREISEFDFTDYTSEFSDGIPISGFQLPIVSTPDFWQPLKECLLNSTRNRHWIAIEKTKRTDTRLDDDSCPRSSMRNSQIMEPRNISQRIDHIGTTLGEEKRQNDVKETKVSLRNSDSITFGADYGVMNNVQEPIKKQNEEYRVYFEENMPHLRSANCINSEQPQEIQQDNGKMSRTKPLKQQIKSKIKNVKRIGTQMLAAR